MAFPVLILIAALSVFGGATTLGARAPAITGPISADIGGGSPTAKAGVDDIGGGTPTHP